MESWIEIKIYIFLKMGFRYQLQYYIKLNNCAGGYNKIWDSSKLLSFILRVLFVSEKVNVSFAHKLRIGYLHMLP